MSSTYFCAFHQEKMKACESDAFRNWSQLMHYGVNAYVHCRTEAANIYLKAAFDIAVLRAKCDLNGIFESMHIIKPADFLIQMLTAENKDKEANALLSQISSIQNDAKIRAFLTKHYANLDNQNLEKQSLEKQNLKKQLQSPSLERKQTGITEQKCMSNNYATTHTHKQPWHTQNTIRALH